MKKGYVYIVANQRNGTIYTGVTSDLAKRIAEHRQGLIPGFSKQHNCKMLVWFEEFSTIQEAIVYEKKIKGWNREKKLYLIEQTNPHWKDVGGV